MERAWNGRWEPIDSQSKANTRGGMIRLTIKVRATTQWMTGATARFTDWNQPRRTWPCSSLQRFLLNSAGVRVRHQLSIHSTPGASLARRCTRMAWNCRYFMIDFSLQGYLALVAYLLCCGSADVSHFRLNLYPIPPATAGTEETFTSVSRDKGGKCDVHGLFGGA